MTGKKTAKSSKISRSIEKYYRLGLFSHFYASAGYLNENQPRWHLRFGEAGSNREDANFPIFDLASLTKPLVTAFLVWQAGLSNSENKEILNNNNWLKPILAGYSDSRPFIFDLLEHTSNLPAWQNFWICHTGLRPLPGDKDWLKRIEEGVLRAAKFRKRADNSCLYSDIGYILLAYLLVKHANNNLGTLFQETLSHCKGEANEFMGFNLPAPKSAFASTGFCPLRQKNLLGEVHDENAYFLGGQAGHAGLFSSPGALESYLRCLLSGTNEISENYRAFLRERSLISTSYFPGGWQRGEGCLLGDFIKNEPGVWLHHFGFTGTSIFHNLDSKFYCTLLTNRVISGRIPGNDIRDIRRLIYQFALSIQDR